MVSSKTYRIVFNVFLVVGGSMFGTAVGSMIVVGFSWLYLLFAVVGVLLAGLAIYGLFFERKGETIYGNNV